MFGYLTSFVYSSEKSQPIGEHILSMLWYCKKVDHVLKIVDKMAEGNNKVPKAFLEQLSEEKVTTHTHKVIKEILSKYNAPSWGVCKKVADYLTDKTPCIASACAIAIGTEKVKWNREFYHKIRVLKSLEMGEWRKLLKDFRKKENYVVIEEVAETKKYSLGLFNEPLHKPVINPSGLDNPILSIHKGTVYKNKHCRTPIEIAMDDPLTQHDINKFVSEKDVNEDIVIITKSVAKDVVPPEGVYVCFIVDTESFADRVYPYVDNTSYTCLDKFFNMVVDVEEN